MNALKTNENVNFPVPKEGIEHSYYRLTGFVTDSRQRDPIVNKLQCAGIHASVGPCAEIYKEQAFTSLGLNPKESLPVSAEIGAKSVVLSVHPSIEKVLPDIIDELRIVFA